MHGAAGAPVLPQEKQGITHTPLLKHAPETRRVPIVKLHAAINRFLREITTTQSRLSGPRTPDPDGIIAAVRRRHQAPETENADRI